MADIMFKFEEVITQEERAIMFAVSNNQKLDKKDINKQLVKARKVNK